MGPTTGSLTMSITGDYESKGFMPHTMVDFEGARQNEGTKCWDVEILRSWESAAGPVNRGNTHCHGNLFTSQTVEHFFVNLFCEYRKFFWPLSSWNTHKTKKPLIPLQLYYQLNVCNYCNMNFPRVDPFDPIMTRQSRSLARSDPRHDSDNADNPYLIILTHREQLHELEISKKITGVRGFMGWWGYTCRIIQFFLCYSSINLKTNCYE